VPAGTKVAGVMLADKRLAGVKLADIEVVGRWAATNADFDKYVVPIVPHAQKPPEPVRVPIRQRDRETERGKETYKGAAGSSSGTVLGALVGLEGSAQALGALPDLNLLSPEPLGLAWSIISASVGSESVRDVDERPRLGEAALGVGTEPAAVDERPREAALVGVVSCLVAPSTVRLTVDLTTVCVCLSMSSSDCLRRVGMLAQYVGCRSNPWLMKN
jgi:hypothetical protein